MSNIFYTRSVNKSNKDASVKHRQHVYDGFPHLSSDTGACMCFNSCCFGDAGCKCGSCSGVGHDGCTDRLRRKQRVRNNVARVKRARTRAELARAELARRYNNSDSSDG
jgi:hypothetical protein